MIEATVVDAKNQLPRLIRRAEQGEPVHITRHGKPVAVLLAEQDYARLIKGGTPQQDFLDFLQQWRARMSADDCAPLSEQEVDALRDQSEGQSRGRDFSYDP